MSDLLQTTSEIEPSKNELISTNKIEDTSKMNYSKMKNNKLKAICKELKIKGITGKKKNELIEMIKQKDAMPNSYEQSLKGRPELVRTPTSTSPVFFAGSAQKIEAKTDVKVEPPVKVEMSWTEWSEKSKNTPFKSTQNGVGDGEQKMSCELDTPIKGQNSSFDMSLTLNGICVKCDVKKLDSQNDFNTGKTGRDFLRPMKMLHTTLLDSISIFENSDIFTREQREKFATVKDASPDELAVGTLHKIKEICEILHEKKTTIHSNLPSVPCTLYSQIKEMPLDIFYHNCQKLGLEFPSEFTPHIESIIILQKMEHAYIDNPAKFMEDLNNIVEKLFNDIRIIIVDEQKGYIILPDITRIRFYRITRGSPRFQVIF
jgi:hypothetical protein